MKFLLFVIVFTNSLFANESISNYKMTVSDGDFNNKVEIKWDTVPGAEYYTLERAYNAPFVTKVGKNHPVETNILVQSKSTRFTDKTIPFGQHIYTVKAYQTNIAPKKETKREQKHREREAEKIGKSIPVPLETNINVIATITDLGHRQVSDKEFFLEFQKGIDSSLPRIRTMKMLNFFGEKKEGWKNGKLIYKTTGIIRRPFRVMIKYTDFIDQGLKLNGTYEVQIFKLLAQQGKLVGTFQVDGIYKGTVTHNLIIDKGQSIGGTYEVQQHGKPMVSLPWDVTTHPLDDSQYEDALKSSLKEAEKNT